MLQTVLRRVLLAVPILLFVTFLVFLIVDLAPGDAAQHLAGDNPTPEAIEAVRQELHLDDPVFVRYGRWVGDAVRGDLGESLRLRRPVWPDVRDRLSVTASLAGLAIAFSIAIALVGGVLAALRPRSWLDRGITWLAAVSIAAPSFWIALLLVKYVAVERKLFGLPALNYVGLDKGFGEWFRHLVLPATALAIVSSAGLAMQLKAALIEVLGGNFVLAARAKGMSTLNIIGKHGLKNAAIPVVTVLGQRIGFLLGGAVTVELLCNLPGLGLYARDAAFVRDIPALLGVVVVSTTVVLLVNMFVDISYGYFNPKVRSA